MLADRDVDIVIGKQIGKHMEEALKMRALKVYEMTGSAWVELLDLLKHVKKIRTPKHLILISIASRCRGVSSA